MDARNAATWLAPDIAAFYARESGPQPAEARILDELRPQLAGAAMLDFGTGGGRTTRHTGNRGTGPS